MNGPWAGSVCPTLHLLTLVKSGNPLAPASPDCFFQQWARNPSPFDLWGHARHSSLEFWKLAGPLCPFPPSNLESPCSQDTVSRQCGNVWCDWNMDWPPFAVLPLITLSSSGKQAHTVLPCCWCSKSLLRIKYNKRKQPSEGQTSNTLLMQHATSQSQRSAPDWFGSPLMRHRSKATTLSEGGVIS